MDIDLNELSTEDLTALGLRVQGELARRRAMSNAQAIIDHANRQYLSASGAAPGTPWRAPTAYYDAYPLGWEVTHNGKTWVSLRDGASGEPGVVTGDWQEKQELGEIVDWVQPHAGSEYPPGALVRHNGHIWRNDYESPNGWEPGATGAQWTDLGPEGEYQPDE